MAVSRWNWDATAYAAVTTQGRTADFSASVWNSIIDKISEQRLDWESSAWDDSVLSLADTKQLTDKNMTAARFNSAAKNILFVPQWPWESAQELNRRLIQPGDICKGQYFIWLAQYLNRWIETLTRIETGGEIHGTNETVALLSLLTMLRVQHSGIIGQFSGQLDPTMLRSFPVRSNTILNSTLTLNPSMLRTLPLHILFGCSADLRATVKRVQSLPIMAPWFMRSILTADTDLLTVLHIAFSLAIQSSVDTEAGVLKAVGVQAMLNQTATFSTKIYLPHLQGVLATLSEAASVSADVTALQGLKTKSNTGIFSYSSAEVAGLAPKHTAGALRAQQYNEMWVREMYGEKIRAALDAVAAFGGRISAHGPAPIVVPIDTVTALTTDIAVLVAASIAGNLLAGLQAAAEIHAPQSLRLAADYDISTALTALSRVLGALHTAGELDFSEVDSAVARIRRAIHAEGTIGITQQGSAILPLLQAIAVIGRLSDVFNVDAGPVVLSTVPAAGMIIGNNQTQLTAHAMPAVPILGRFAFALDGKANPHLGMTCGFEGESDINSDATMEVVLLNAQLFKAALSAQAAVSADVNAADVQSVSASLPIQSTMTGLVSAQAEQYVLVSALDSKMASELDNTLVTNVEIELV